RDKPVLSLTKVNSVLDDAEQHAGAYDFYIFTGGTGEMILGGKIANRQHLQDKDGIIPGEYRGQPVVGGQTYKVKAGDWLLIPPDTQHQPKPDPGGFSYFIMKINVGAYLGRLIRWSNAGTLKGKVSRIGGVRKWFVRLGMSELLANGGECFLRRADVAVI